MPSDAICFSDYLFPSAHVQQLLLLPPPAEDCDTKQMLVNVFFTANQISTHQ